MVFITETQKIVVERRLTMGYELLGITRAQLNGLSAFVTQKGRHIMCINSLGYCEHYNGRTYSNLEEPVDAVTQYYNDRTTKSWHGH